MFTPGPSKEDIAKMRNLGLSPEDYAGDVVEVWPENERAYFLFIDLQTQWRVGMGGATGLDYLVLFAKLDRMKLTDEDASDLEQDIRAMEHEALRAMSERDEG
jgi:hypothetical protein